jgi:hypothetical protein
MVFTELMDALLKKDEVRALPYIEGRNMDYLNEEYQSATALHLAIAADSFKCFLGLIRRGVKMGKKFDTNAFTHLPYSVDDIATCLNGVKFTEHDPKVWDPYRNGYYNYTFEVNKIPERKVAIDNLVRGETYDELDMAKKLGRVEMKAILDVLNGIIGTYIYVYVGISECAYVIDDINIYSRLTRQ